MLAQMMEPQMLPLLVAGFIVVVTVFVSEVFWSNSEVAFTVRTSVLTEVVFGIVTVTETVTLAPGWSTGVLFMEFDSRKPFCELTNRSKVSGRLPLFCTAKL